MGVKTDFSGMDRFQQAVREAADSSVNSIAEDINSDVRRSMGTGARGVASAPGTPPNRQTNTLTNSINVQKIAALRYTVGTNLEYAAIHEFGGIIRAKNGAPIRMPARPYLQPAAARARINATGNFRRYLARNLARRAW